MTWRFTPARHSLTLANGLLKVGLSFLEIVCKAHLLSPSNGKAPSSRFSPTCVQQEQERWQSPDTHGPFSTANTTQAVT